MIRWHKILRELKHGWTLIQLIQITIQIQQLIRWYKEIKMTGILNCNNKIQMCLEVMENRDKVT